MNTSSFGLPVLGDFSSTPSLFPISNGGKRGDKSLPFVEKARSSAPILGKNPFGNNTDVGSVQYLSGCAQQCAFCSSQPFLSPEGELTVGLAANAAQRLAEELSHNFRLLRAVYVCPHSDPFPPLLEVQQETTRVLEVLGQHRVQSWIMTRGYIRPLAMEVLVRFKDQVKIMIGMTTLDRSWQRALEPLSAPPRMRLKQIRQLRSLGIPVQVALEPLLPGVTDTRENLLPLLENLAEAGVERITAGYLFLPAGSQETIQQKLQAQGWETLVMDAYNDGILQRTSINGTAKYLSKARRQRGYALLMALAAPFGISVSVSSLSNPDFAKPEPAKVFAQPRFACMDVNNTLSI